MSGLDVFSGVSHSRPQSPSFLGLLGRLQIKPSGSGDENRRFCNCFEGLATGAQRMSGLDVFSGVSHSRPQSPSFLGLLGRLQIKPSGSGDENRRFCNCFEG